MWHVEFKRALITAVLAVSALAGCGPKPLGAKLAQIESAPMPENATWEGVYFSPLFGTLHLVPEGNLINGRWQRPSKGEWGKLQGNANGSVLRFDWDEYKDGLVGPNSKKSGKGYFVYSRPDGDNVDDILKGAIGRGADETGSDWVAIKQRNVKANIHSIGGVGAADVGGGDWDKGNGESSEVEAPTGTTEEK